MPCTHVLCTHGIVPTSSRHLPSRGVWKVCMEAQMGKAVGTPPQLYCVPYKNSASQSFPEPTCSLYFLQQPPLEDQMRAWNHTHLGLACHWGAIIQLQQPIHPISV